FRRHFSFRCFGAFQMKNIPGCVPGMVVFSVVDKGTLDRLLPDKAPRLLDGGDRLGEGLLGLSETYLNVILRRLLYLGCLLLGILDNGRGVGCRLLGYPVVVEEILGLGFGRGNFSVMLFFGL